nr:ubiquitin-specific protease 13 [Tanacetum cinerariifolium]
KKKTKGKGKGPSKPTKKVLSDNQIRREIFLSDYPPLLSRTVPSSFCHAIRDAKDDEFVQLWLSQFAPKKKKRIFATDIAEKLVCSTKVDFMFKVNFLMLFANVMGKADTMRTFVNLSVVRRIREDTNIAGLDWYDFIHRCLAITHEPNTVSGFYNGPLCFLIEKAEVEILLRDANKEFSNDDNVKQLFEQYKGFFKETVLLEEPKAHKAHQNVKPKPAAEKTKEAAEAPQNVKPKPTAVKTKEEAEKPKPTENVKEVAEKPQESDEKAHEAPQYVKPKPAAVKTKETAEKPMPAENVKELADKPKESAGDDYQVVPAATVMKAEDREEFEVETFTQWIEGNIDWVGEMIDSISAAYLDDDLHDWPRVVKPVNMVQPSNPKRVFSSPRKGYVKPVKTVNTPYMCRRIDVTACCKRIEFMLGNSLFAVEGIKIICETIKEKLSSISKEKAEAEILLRDANKEFPNDDNVKQLFEQYKGFFKETVLLEEVKAHKAPQIVKPKSAAVKIKEAAKKPKPDENTKEAAEKPMPAENVKELAKKPKEPAGDDYQVVPAATVMKAEYREEFEVETLTQMSYMPGLGLLSLLIWIIDVTARCKRIEFMLGNSLFAMEGDKYETVFQSLGGYRELSSNQGIIKGTLTEEEQWKSFYDDIKAQFKYEPSSMSLSDFELVVFPIYASGHFYVVVFNIKKSKTMVILDNSDSGYTYALKYTEACDPLRMRYKIATKIMLHQFNVVSNKMFDFAFTFETKYT